MNITSPPPKPPEPPPAPIFHIPMRVFVCVLAPQKDCMKNQLHYTRGFFAIGIEAQPLAAMIVS